MNNHHPDIRDMLDNEDIYLTHSVFAVFCLFFIFSMSDGQHFEEAGTKHQGHHANGNDDNLARTNNASSSIRGFLNIS
jgi:hypothetical protein